MKTITVISIFYQIRSEQYMRLSLRLYLIAFNTYRTTNSQTSHKSFLLMTDKNNEIVTIKSSSNNLMN